MKISSLTSAFLAACIICIGVACGLMLFAAFMVLFVKFPFVVGGSIMFALLWHHVYTHMRKDD